MARPGTVVEHQEFNDENSLQIIYGILNAESHSAGEDTSRFRIVSSYPLVVNGVEYHPCALTREQSGHDTPFPVTPHHEIKRLYNQNPSGRGSFWKGIGQILDDLLDSSPDSPPDSPHLSKPCRAFFRQPYSLGEFLESFYDLGRTSPQSVSDALRKLVDEGKFKGQAVLMWSPEECSGTEHPFTASQFYDAHYSMIMALAVHQQRIDTSYWFDKIGKEPDHFLAHFTGLGHSDVGVAEAYALGTVGVNGCALFSNESVQTRFRGIERRIARP